MEGQPQNPEFRNNPENLSSHGLCKTCIDLNSLPPGKLSMLFCHLLFFC